MTEEKLEPNTEARTGSINGRPVLVFDGVPSELLDAGDIDLLLVHPPQGWDVYQAKDAAHMMLAPEAVRWDKAHDDERSWIEVVEDVLTEAGYELVPWVFAGSYQLPEVPHSGAAN